MQYKHINFATSVVQLFNNVLQIKKIFNENTTLTLIF